MDSRELTADDYIYQIKRLAHPRLHSPIFGMMADKIVGLKALGERLGKVAKDLPADEWLDLDQFPLTGIEKLDSHTWRIRIKGKYPSSSRMTRSVRKSDCAIRPALPWAFSASSALTRSTVQ